jgi:hypothetical protein
MTSNSAAQALTFDDLMSLREKTERLSSFLTGRLRTHISTLYPLLAPKRVFGPYVGAKESVPRSEEAYNQLVERFREIAGPPFDFRPELDEQTLGNMEYGIEIYPWEYPYDIGGRNITITSPVKWILTYRTEYTPSQMRNLLASKGERRPLPIRQFAANALALQVVVSRVAGVAELLADLRYAVEPALVPGFGRLKFLTISCPIQSFRPLDELIQTATRFSGVPAFNELVAADAADHLDDPLRHAIASVLA